jgi:MFS family permease
MSVGAIVASSAIAYLLTWMSWQSAFFWLALPGFIWAAGFYLWFRDTPAEHPAVNAAERALIQEGKPAEEPGPAPPVPWFTLFTSSLMLLICFQQFCRAAAYGFYQSWFPTYLQKTRDVEVDDSGYLNSLAMTGYVLGSICAGVLSDWIQARTGRKRLSRQALALVSMAGSALSLLAAHFIADATQAVLVIAVGMFWAGLSGPVGYSITIDTGGRHVTAVFSTMNMCGNLGAFLMPSVIGWLVGLPSVSWDDVLLLFVGLYVVAGVCWLLINPEGSIFSTEKNADELRSDQVPLTASDMDETDRE